MVTVYKYKPLACVFVVCSHCVDASFTPHSSCQDRTTLLELVEIRVVGRLEIFSKPPHSATLPPLRRVELHFTMSTSYVCDGSSGRLIPGRSRVRTTGARLRVSCLSVRQQHPFFQMSCRVGVRGGVRIVRHHHDRLMEIFVQAL